VALFWAETIPYLGTLALPDARPRLFVPSPPFYGFFIDVFLILSIAISKAPPTPNDPYPRQVISISMTPTEQTANHRDAHLYNFETHEDRCPFLLVPFYGLLKRKNGPIRSRTISRRQLFAQPINQRKMRRRCCAHCRRHGKCADR